MDDTGPWYPVVTSLFWVLRGWQAGGSERDRVKANLQFVADMGFDGVRILYDVNWNSGLAVHGTPVGLAELLNYGRLELGLRFKITVTGGSTTDVLRLASEVRYVAQAYPDAVLLLEAVNEGNTTRDDAIAMARILRESGVPTSVGRGNQGLEDLVACGMDAGTNVDSYHIERSGEWDRWIRQGWDFHGLTKGSDNGEPMGPGSSAVSTEDTFILACLRAGGIINGAGLYCHHTGDGVFGYSYNGPTGWRYANLFDRPNAAAQFTAVRNASTPFYLGMENWHHYNKDLPVEIVGEGKVDKQQGCRAGKDFVQIHTNVKGVPQFKTNEPVEWFVLINPETGQVVDANAGLRAYVVIGKLA